MSVEKMMFNDVKFKCVKCEIFMKFYVDYWIIFMI